MNSIHNANIQFGEDLIMKKLWVILFILFTSSLLIAQNRIQVAILEFSGEGLSTSEARIITSRFRSSLFETQKYIVD